MGAYVALISLTLLASPALAQPLSDPAASSAGLATDNQDAPEANGVSGEQTVDSERRICRRVETATGSRMNYRRVCRTAAEWRETMRRGS